MQGVDAKQILKPCRGPIWRVSTHSRIGSKSPTAHGHLPPKHRLERGHTGCRAVFTSRYGRH